MITFDELKKQLHYNPDTGDFTWLVSNTNSIKIGDIAGCKENGNSYTRIFVNKKSYKAHRLAWFYMTGEWPVTFIDHINGVKYDNKFNNLREATFIENQHNVPKRIDNSTGYKGVSFHKPSLKFAAYAMVNKKRFWLGLFETAKLAALSYENFVKQHHGSFYRKVNATELTED